jgi:hypothetical protein
VAAPELLDQLANRLWPIDPRQHPSATALKLTMVKAVRLALS